MRLVIADTGPINYLILINCIGILPRLFERVALPKMVESELSDPRAPLAIQRWIAKAPLWLEIHETGPVPDMGLDAGESAAIALAEHLHADLLLIDERAGSRVAKEKGLRVTGTLGILDIAAERGLVDFVQSIESLKQTSFRLPAPVIEALIKKHGG